MLTLTGQSKCLFVTLREPRAPGLWAIEGNAFAMNCSRKRGVSVKK